MPLPMSLSMPSSRTTPRTRLCISSLGTPRFSMPNAISPVVSRLKNWVWGFWKTLPVKDESSQSSRSSMSLPATRTFPVRLPS